MTDSSSSARRHLRIPQPAQLRVEGGAARFLGYLAEISETGSFIQSSNPRARGSQLELLLRLPGEGDGIPIELAEVVWTRGYSGRNGPCPGMGIRFVALSDTAQAAVSRFLAQSEADPCGGATGVNEDCP